MYHVERLDKIRRMLWRKASRDWPCKFCSLPIRKGEHYWDGGTPGFRMHSECRPEDLRELEVQSGGGRVP